MKRSEIPTHNKFLISIIASFVLIKSRTVADLRSTLLSNLCLQFCFLNTINRLNKFSHFTHVMMVLMCFKLSIQSNQILKQTTQLVRTVVLSHDY